MLVTRPITTLVKAVNYEAAGRRFEISLNNGARLLLPVDLLVMELFKGSVKAD